ncbi:MAG: hypothetical protein GXY76_16410 [Chloroflexi bacterium]|nr:hypothetical protein [Chloroflexota bacterium]
MAASGGHWSKGAGGATFVASPPKASSPAPPAALAKTLGEIERLSQTARARREGARDASLRALRPADADWLSQDERNRLDRLQGQAAILGRQVFGTSQERVALKRALRAAGVTFDHNAPLATLQRLVAGLKARR